MLDWVVTGYNIYEYFYRSMQRWLSEILAEGSIRQKIVLYWKSKHWYSWPIRSNVQFFRVMNLLTSSTWHFFDEGFMSAFYRWNRRFSFSLIFRKLIGLNSRRAAMLFSSFICWWAPRPVLYKEADMTVCDHFYYSTSRNSTELSMKFLHDPECRIPHLSVVKCKKWIMRRVATCTCKKYSGHLPSYFPRLTTPNIVHFTMNEMPLKYIICYA